jgi:hypothetical protein
MDDLAPGTAKGVEHAPQVAIRKWSSAQSPV